MRGEGNTTTHLAFLSTVQKSGVEPASGLQGATVIGSPTKGVNTSSLTLIMTQARCGQDDGVYTCKVTVLMPNPKRTVSIEDKTNLTIAGEALSVRTRWRTRTSTLVLSVCLSVCPPPSLSLPPLSYILTESGKLAFRLSV